MNELIYVTEDEENIQELLRCTLEAFGYTVRCFGDASGMLKACGVQTPNLVLLDIMMPGIDGVTALKILRQSERTRDIPVIFLTAKSSEVDKVTGLDEGADDYITKPFGLLELTARVRAALRRNTATPGDQENLLVRGELSVNLNSREVTLGGTLVELTLKEFELIRLFLQNPNRVLNREELLNTVWGYDFMGETRTLDMHVKTLRAKLQDDAEHPKYIKTVRGVGYKLV